LGPGGRRRRDGRRNWRGGRLALVLLPVAAGMEPVGMGLLAVTISPLANPQTCHRVAHPAVCSPDRFLAQK